MTILYTITGFTLNRGFIEGSTVKRGGYTRTGELLIRNIFIIFFLIIIVFLLRKRKSRTIEQPHDGLIGKKQGGAHFRRPGLMKSFTTKRGVFRPGWNCEEKKSTNLLEKRKTDETKRFPQNPKQACFFGICQLGNPLIRAFPINTPSTALALSRLATRCCLFLSELNLPSL